MYASQASFSEYQEAELRFLLMNVAYGARIPFIVVIDMEQRTLRADARRNRERIMASARELFAREGPDAQMDDIAAHAGVGIGTVYRHFPTKEALLTAMVRDRFAVFAEIARAAEQIADPFDALATMMRESAEAVEHDMGFQLAMMGANELDWDGVELEKAALTEVVARIIERAVVTGAVRPDLSGEDYPMIMCGITSTMYFKPGSADWRRHLELVLQGIRAQTAEHD
jgi:AcrR family transcriptional regulator